MRKCEQDKAVKLRSVRGWNGVKRYVRYQWLRLLRIEAEPEVIACGLAIGVFVGFIPFMPSQIVIAIGIAFVLRASKVAATLGTLVSNPLTFMPLYLMYYKVGRWLVPFDVPAVDLTGMDPVLILETGWRTVAAMICGGCLLGLPAAFIAYMATYRGICLYRERRKTHPGRHRHPPEDSGCP